MAKRFLFWQFMLKKIKKEGNIMWIKTYQNILVNLDNMDIITIRQRDDKNMELCEIATYYENECKSVAIK